MPIEVHCPNPICARVHIVKSRYAGMRGKCPACGSWMYVPRTGYQPSLAVPRPEGLEEAAAAWKSPPAAPARAEKEEVTAVLFEDDATIVHQEHSPRVQGERAAPAEEVLDAVEPDVVEAEKPRRGLGWLVTSLVVLGMLSLGAVSASPYLEMATTPATGEFAQDIGAQPPRGIPDEQAAWVTWGSAGVAAGALLCLLAGLVAGRFGFASVFLLYLTTLASAGIFFLGTFYFRNETKMLDRVREKVENRKALGTKGDVTVNPGQQVYALAGGAAAACLAFLLAAVLMHHRWWSRLLGFVFLGFFIALGPVWVYRAELGIDGFVPAEIGKMIPL
jgi:hypothetical protein